MYHGVLDTISSSYGEAPVPELSGGSGLLVAAVAMGSLSAPYLLFERSGRHSSDRCGENGCAAISSHSPAWGQLFITDPVNCCRVVMTDCGMPQRELFLFIF